MKKEEMNNKEKDLIKGSDKYLRKMAHGETIWIKKSISTPEGWEITSRVFRIKTQITL